MSFNLTQEEAANLRKERKEMFLDVIKRRKKPERIPMISSDSLWKINDSGEKFSVALTDFERLFEIMCEYHERYNFDCYTGYSARNTIGYVNALGEGMYILEDDPNSLQIKDNFPMRADEYSTLAEKGILKFCLEDLFARAYDYKTKEEAMEHLKKAVPELLAYNDYCTRTREQFVGHYGVPKIEASAYNHPFEYLPWGLRGIKATAVDLRRHPEEIIEAMEKIDEYYWPQFVHAAENLPQESDEFVFHSSICPMAYTLLSPKQFEKFYWPWMKKYFDWVAEHDQIGYIFAEGSFRNKVDYLRDVEEKRFGILVEEDDPAEVKQLLPNMTVIGGYPSLTLGGEDTEANLAKIKEIVETCAYDGNYIFSFDKMLTFPNDAKRENILAVVGYLRSVKP